MDHQTRDFDDGIRRPRARLGRTLVGVHLVTASFAAFVPLAGFLPPDSRITLLLVGQIGLGVLALIWDINGGWLQQLVTPNRLLGRQLGAWRGRHGRKSGGRSRGRVACLARGLQLTLRWLRRVQRSRLCCSGCRRCAACARWRRGDAWHPESWLLPCGR